MRTRKLIFTFLILSLRMMPCSCRDIDDYFLFFKYNNFSFIGKPIKVTNKGAYQTYDFVVLDKLRSKYTGTISINNKSSGVGCQIGFDIDSTYIIGPGVKDGCLNIERCDYIVSGNETHFKDDIMLIKLFSKPSFTVDCGYFKGTVKNGKQAGHWKIGTDEGDYNNGKKEGKWIENGDEKYYKHDKLVRSIEYMNDTTKMETINDKYYMYYKSGSIFKLIDYGKRTYTVYFLNGKIKEQAKINKKNFIIGPWVKYNSDGTIKEKVEIDERYPEHVRDAFWTIGN